MGQESLVSSALEKAPMDLALGWPVLLQGRCLPSWPEAAPRRRLLIPRRRRVARRKSLVL